MELGETEEGEGGGGGGGLLCRQRDAYIFTPESNRFLLNTVSGILMIFCGTQNRDCLKSWYPLQILPYVFNFSPCFSI